MSLALNKLTKRLLLVCASYFVGETLLRGALQKGMDCCIGFWGVMGEIIKPENWSIGWAAEILIVSAVITILDWFTPRKIGTGALLLIGAFAGAYYQAMLPYDYLGRAGLELTKLLESHLPHGAVNPVFFFALLWLVLLPIALLLLLKLVGHWVGPNSEKASDL